MHGPVVLRWASTLKFGASMLADASPNMILLPPSEYFVTIPGFKEPPYSATGPMPATISSLLDSWTIDTSKNHPQYILNTNYMLDQPDSARMNGLTVVLQKSFAQNNLRILLHGGETPTDTDNQLIFIDIDEENMYSPLNQAVR